MKKLLSILLATVLLLTCIPLGAVSVSAATYAYGDLTYEIINRKITITDCKTTASGALTIPSYIAGYPVTAIGDRAFEDCGSLTSVTIPSSVTTIGSWVFHNCTSLTSVTIPDSVTTIGSWVFYNCTSLTSVTIPDSVTTIGERTFCLCFSLTSVTIPDSVTTIGEGMFYGCRSLTTMIIPYSVTTIGDNAFYACNALTSVAIPNSVTSIGSYAFGACRSLTSIEVATTNRHYSSLDGVLFNKDKTILIQYPIGKVGAYTIPDSVTNIKANAFNSCTNLTDIYYSGTEVDKANILIGGGNTYLLGATWHYANGNVSGKCGADATWIYYEDEEKLVISGTGTVVGDWRSYAPCYVIIEEGITDVGDTYFASTYGDVYVLVIPSTLTSVGNESFMCGARTVILNSAIIAANASTYDSVGYLFFNNTTILVNASISKKGSYISGSYTESVTVNGTAYRMYSDHEHGYKKVTSDDFSGAQCASCYMPKDVFADAGNFIYTLSNGKITITGVYESVSELIVPDTIGGYPVTTIGSWAFENCTSLTSVTIPDSVTTIRKYAFYVSDSLTDVYYVGAEEDCAAMNIEDYGNDYLLNATWHYVCKHEYFSACDMVCLICNEVSREASHNVVHVPAVANTCYTEGNIEYWYCDVCGYAWLDEDCTLNTNLKAVILPAAHSDDLNYDPYHHSYRCTICGEVVWSHFIQHVPAVTPTHFTEGNVEYWYCEMCGTYFLDEACTEIVEYETTIILPISHNIVHVEAKAPTCTELGNIEYWYCTECGYAWLNEDCTLNTNLKAVILPMAEHTYDHSYDTDCNECGNIRTMSAPATFGGNSVSEDVSGLAFRFDVSVVGMKMNRTTAIYNGATIDDYKLIKMGAIVTNRVATIDIPCVYLWELKSDSCSFAVRLINIPTDKYDVAITATPYVVLEIDGVATTIYGEAQTSTYNNASIG